MSTVDINDVTARFVGRMRALRKHRHMTAVDVDVKAGLPKGAIGKVEASMRGVSLNDAVRIAEVLGVSVDQMCSPEPMTVVLRADPETVVIP